MSATIVLPTYRRPESLPWALASVLLQRLDAPRQVIVVNNGGEEAPVEEAVEAAIQRYGDRGWRVHVVHRRPAMDPVTSWYAAIFEYARPGDMVVLHGDDDLLLPGTLEARAVALASVGADFLLSRSSGGLYFDAERPGLTLASPSARSTHRTAALPQAIGIKDALNWEPGFIGTHTYRLGTVLGKAYERVCQEARKLPLDEGTALTVVPLLLPIPVAEMGCLAGFDHTGCVRGQSRQTITRARLGHTNWSPGIIYAASLKILEGESLGGRLELEPWRDMLRDSLAEWYVPTLSARSTRRQLRSLGHGGPGPHLARNAGEVLHGARLVAVYTLRLQGLRLRWNWLARAAGYRIEDAKVLIDGLFLPAR